MNGVWLRQLLAVLRLECKKTLLSKRGDKFGMVPIARSTSIASISFWIVAFDFGLVWIEIDFFEAAIVLSSRGSTKIMVCSDIEITNFLCFDCIAADRDSSAPWRLRRPSATSTAISTARSVGRTPSAVRMKS